MGIITWLIFGAIAGWVASIIVGTNARQGIIGNIFVGIFGAMLGGFIANVIGGDGISGFNIYSMIVAVGGSVVLLWIMRSIFVR